MPLKTGKMKYRRVLWGTNEEDKTVLLAIELHPEKNKIDVYVFPESVATEEFSQQMTKVWRKGEDLAFPPEHTLIERELSISESILPDNLKVERGDVIQRAQTEWQFVVLSTKLNAVYQGELAELKSKVDDLEEYSGEVWDSLKEFWDKIQTQAREKNLFGEHIGQLRDGTNALFGQLKDMRSKLNDELKEQSKEHYDSFMSALKDIEERVEGGARLQGLFNELRDLQRKFKESKLVREHQNKVYQRIDKAFKTVKAKRFGDGGGGGGNDRSQLQRIQSRYQGLLGAIERMERNIKRGKDDLKFQEHRIANSDGQLEAQIRQAKIKMIQERVTSMEIKLEDMNKTKAELERRMEKEKEREAKRAAKAEQDKAKAQAAEAAKAKIQAEMQKVSKPSKTTFLSYLKVSSARTLRFVIMF